MISFSPWTIILPLLQELKYEMYLPHFPNYRINLLNFTFLSKSELEKILFSTGIILDRPNCSVIAFFVLCIALFCYFCWVVNGRFMPINIRRKSHLLGKKLPQAWICKELCKNCHSFPGRPDLPVNDGWEKHKEVFTTWNADEVLK